MSDWYAPPNGSRLSCGWRAGGRKGPARREDAGEATADSLKTKSVSFKR